MSKLSLLLLRGFTVLFSGLLGLWLAFPLSYWFQSDIYKEMCWEDYIDGGARSLLIGAQFGTLTIYVYTAIGLIILFLLFGVFLVRVTRTKKRH